MRKTRNFIRARKVLQSNQVLIRHIACLAESTCSRETQPTTRVRSHSRGIMKNRCIAFLHAVIGSGRGQCANNNLIHRGDHSLASSIYGAPVRTQPCAIARTRRALARPGRVYVYTPRFRTQHVMKTSLTTSFPFINSETTGIILSYARISVTREEREREKNNSENSELRIWVTNRNSLEIRFSLSRMKYARMRLNFVIYVNCVKWTLILQNFYLISKMFDNGHLIRINNGTKSFLKKNLDWSTLFKSA